MNMKKDKESKHKKLMGICTEGNKEKQANKKPWNSFYRKEGRYTQHHYSLQEVHHLN